MRQCIIFELNVTIYAKCNAKQTNNSAVAVLMMSMEHKFYNEKYERNVRIL